MTHSAGDTRFTQGVFSDTLIYPDSAVCTLLVHDRNDSILSVPEQNAPWPGYLKQPALNYAEKQIIPICTASAMGIRYSGTWYIKDRFGIPDSMNYNVLHTARDRFRGWKPDPSYWVPYNENYLGSSIVIDRPPDGPLNFSFSEGMKYNVTGMHSPYVLSGDFEIHVSYRLWSEESHDTDLWFVVSTGTDTSWFMLQDKYAGIRLAGGGGAEWGDLGEGQTQSGGLDQVGLAGDLTIARTNGVLTFYHRPEFALESHRLGDSTTTTLFSFPHDSLRVHVRFTTDDQGVRRGPCVIREYMVSKGMIQRLER